MFSGTVVCTRGGDIVSTVKVVCSLEVMWSLLSRLAPAHEVFPVSVSKLSLF